MNQKQAEEYRFKHIGSPEYWQAMGYRKALEGEEFKALKDELEKMEDDRNRWADSACRLEPQLLSERVRTKSLVSELELYHEIKKHECDSTCGTRTLLCSYSKAVKQ